MAKVKQEITPSPLKQTLKRKIGYGGDEDDGLAEASRKFKGMTVDKT